ncbi:unnamed protein product, partial [Prorocentrum cordatum]
LSPAARRPLGEGGPPGEPAGRGSRASSPPSASGDAADRRAAGAFGSARGSCSSNLGEAGAAPLLTPPSQPIPLLAPPSGRSSAERGPLARALVGRGCPEPGGEDEISPISRDAAVSFPTLFGWPQQAPPRRVDDAGAPPWPMSAGGEAPRAGDRGHSYSPLLAVGHEPSCSKDSFASPGEVLRLLQDVQQASPAKAPAALSGGEESRGDCSPAREDRWAAAPQDASREVARVRARITAELDCLTEALAESFASGPAAVRRAD